MIAIPWWLLLYLVSVVCCYLLLRKTHKAVMIKEPHYTREWCYGFAFSSAAFSLLGPLGLVVVVIIYLTETGFWERPCSF